MQAGRLSIDESGLIDLESGVAAFAASEVPEGNGSDSMFALRAEYLRQRIDEVRQRVIGLEIENRVRRGELTPTAIVLDVVERQFVTVKARFYAAIPGVAARSAHRSETEVSEAMRKSLDDTLTELSSQEVVKQAEAKARKERLKK